MNKKKILVMLSAVTLVAVIGIGATLAYFTDKDAATNVITMGHVDIDLDEPNFDPTPDGEKDNKIEDIVPGQEIVKDPTITVAEDSQDAYIRAKIEFSDNLSAEQQADLLEGINVDFTVWFLGADGYYYYKDVVSAGNKVVLFDTVVIPEKWGNEVADVTFEINISAEAIQADYFEPERNGDGMIIAWKYSDDTPITAENYVAPAPAE